MKTAGLPCLLLLLSLLLIRTESNTTNLLLGIGPGPDGQSTPTKTPTTPNNNTTTDIGGGKPDSNATSSVTQTGPTLKPEDSTNSNATSSVTQTGPTVNPKKPEDSTKTKPTDAATVVTSTQGSTLETETVTTPSGNKTGQIEGNAGQTGNRTKSTDTAINTTGKDGKPKETGPTVAGLKSSKAPNTTVAISGTPTPKPDVPITKRSGDIFSDKGSDKHKGPTTEPVKDKKMLWILLPVLGVLVAGVIFVLKKYTKGHGHTGTAENGTENASFQSRSESNKDGVMLLGVKTSEGEGNAAAR